MVRFRKYSDVTLTTSLIGTYSIGQDCTKWIGEVFKTCLQQDFVSVIITKEKDNVIQSKFVKCILNFLFWLGDEKAWLSFSTNIKKSPSPKVESVANLVGDVLASVLTMYAITPAARGAFYQLANHFDVLAQAPMRDDDLGRLPSATLPPEMLPYFQDVEDFLRSAFKSYTITNFRTLKKAQHFALGLSDFQKTDNCMFRVEVDVGLTNDGKPLCLITKDLLFCLQQRDIRTQERSDMLKSVSAKLKKICARNEPLNVPLNVPPNEPLNKPPYKRVKP